MGLKQKKRKERLYTNFILKLEQAIIAESEWRPERIYPLLQENLKLIDETFVLKLDDLTKRTFREEMEDARLAFFLDLAIIFQYFDQGNPVVNIAIVVTGYKYVVQVFRQRNVENHLSQTLGDLGNAYLTQAEMGINPVESLKEAVITYQEAVQIQRKLSLELNLSRTLSNLGYAYLFQAKLGIDSAENLNRAITAHEEAARIQQKLDTQCDLSSTLSHLGYAYCFRAGLGIDSVKNLNQAIIAHEEAARLQQQQGLKHDLSQTLTNLSKAYLFQAKLGIDSAENLTRMIAAHEEAARVQQQSGLERDLSATLNGLGNAYCTQAELGINPTENLTQAITVYQQAAQIFRQQSAEQDLSGTLYNLGNAYRTQAELGINPPQNLTLALLAYQEAVQILRQPGLEHNLSVAEILNNLGVTYAAQAEIGIDPAHSYSQAIVAYQEAANIQRQPGLERGLSQTLYNLGIAYKTQAELGINPPDNLTQAIAAYQEAANIQRQPGLERDLSETLNNLGNAYITQAQLGINPQDNLTQALVAYQEAANIQRPPGLESDLSETLNNLGNAYLVQAELGINPPDNLTQALAAYQEAANIQRQPGLEHDLSGTLAYLGNVYRTQAELGINPQENSTRAITALQEAAQIRRQPGLERDLSGTLNNLGNAYSVQAELGINPQENLTRAITALQEAAQIQRQPGLERGLSQTLDNLGTAYSVQAELGINPQENLNRAITAHEEAAQIQRQRGLDFDLSRTLTNLGTTYITQAQQLGINPTKNLREAIMALQEATQIQRQPGLERSLSGTLTNLGTAYRTQAELGINPQENLTQGIQMYREALAIVTPEISATHYAKFGENLGNLGWAHKRWEIAVEGYNQALQGIEQSRHWASTHQGKQEILTNALDIYERLIIAALNANQLDIAWQAIERSKSRLLVDLLANAELLPNSATEEQRERLQALRRQVETLSIRVEPNFSSNNSINIDRPDSGQRQGLTSNPDNPNDPQKLLAQARQELNQLLDELKPDNPDFVLTQRVDPLNFDQLQDLLDDQTALLQWYVGSENLLCFVITKTHIAPIPFTSADRETLQAIAADYFSDYGQATWGNTLQSRLEQLATCLDIPRLMEAIPDHCQELILIPHRFLHLFPLHALIPPDRFPCGIRYAPSAQLLHRLSQRPAKPQGDRPYLFAVSNPTEDLPWAEAEVNAIQSLFAPHVHVLARSNANLSAFNAPDNQRHLKQSHVVHFSCHGGFSAANPLQTALFLAGSIQLSPPGNPPDDRAIPLSGDRKGIPSAGLTLEAIFNALDLPQAQLVTLSACETGLTDPSQLTDEYIGLSSGFLYSGVATVVSSLWRVSDLATALLMIRFYQLRFDPNNPLSTAQALQQAQTWLRTSTAQQIRQWLQTAPLESPKKNEIMDTLSYAYLGEEIPFAAPQYWAAFCSIGL